MSRAATFPVYEPTRAVGKQITLDGPDDIAEDSQGNIYIRDQRGHVKKLSPSGEFIKIIGHYGNTDGGFHFPWGDGGIAIDSQDNLWIVDSNEHRIQKFDSDGNFLLKIGTYGTSGTSDGLFKSPDSIAVDSSDNIYVTDTGNHRIQKFDSNGVFQWKVGGLVAGTGDGQFNEPRGIAVNGSDIIYVGDNKNNRVQKFTSDGVFISKFGEILPGGFYCSPDPYLVNANLEFDSSDNLYISSWGGGFLCSGRVYQYDTNDTYIGKLPISDNLYNILINSADNLIGIRNIASYTYDITEYQLDGTVIRSIGDGLDDGHFRDNAAMTEDEYGNLYVLDYGNRRVQKFDPSGQHLLTFGSSGNNPGQLSEPTDIGVDSQGNILISEAYLARITKFDPTGNYVSHFDKKGSDPGLFYNGIERFALDEDDNIYAIGFPTGNVIEKFSPDGTYLQTIGTPGTGVGLVSELRDLEFDESGQLYALNIATSSRGRVTVFNPDGSYSRQMITSVYPPWGGDRINARYYELELDTQGNMYIGEPDNDNIAVFSNDGSYLNSFGSSLTGYDLGNGSGSREFSLFVSKIDNELFLNGDFDHIKVFGIDRYAAPPTAPTNTTAVQASSGLLRVDWEPPTDNGGVDPYAYTVEYRPSGTNQWIYHYVDWEFLLPLEARSAEIGLPDGTYDVRVSSRNPAGIGEYSEINNVRVTAKYKIKERKNLTNAGLRGVAFDSEGEMYVANEYEPDVQHYDPDTDTLTTIYGEYGTGEGQIRSIEHMIIGPDDRLYIADSGNDRIHIIETDGTPVKTFGAPGTEDGQFNYLTRLQFDKDDNLYAVDYRKVQKFDKDGNFIEQITPEIIRPTSIAFDSQDNMFIFSDAYEPEDFGIHKYDASGNKLHRFGIEGEAIGEFYSTYYMAIDKEDNVVVGDVWNGRLYTYDNDGTLVDWFGRYGMYEDEFTEWPYSVFEEMSSLDPTPDGDLILGDAYYGVDYPGYIVLGLADAASIVVPSEPQDLTADTSVPKRIKLDWTPPAQDGGSPVTKYKVEHKPSSSGASSWIETEVGSGTLTHVIDNIQAGNHDVKVSAGNGNGYGIPAFLNGVVVADEPETNPEPDPDTTPEPSPPPVTRPPTSSTDTDTSTTAPPATVIIQPAPYPSIDDSTSSEPEEKQDESESESSEKSLETEVNDETGEVTVVWESPTDTPEAPTGYVVETRPDEDTVWEKVEATGPNETSAVIVLPPGDHQLRVVALIPTKSNSRVVVGTAWVTVGNKPIVEGDGHISAPVKDSISLSTWITVFIGGLMVAVFFWIPIAWKKRKKRQEEDRAKAQQAQQQQPYNPYFNQQ